MYLFAIGSVSCLIPRLLDGGLGIRRCVSYVNAIIPCDCLVFLERQCHPVASALTASALASLSGGPWVRGGGRGESQELSYHVCK